MSLFYYVIDTETTGLAANWAEITEVSIIRCVDKVQLTEHIKCDHPERASIDAMRITKKTLSDLAKGNSKEFVVNKLNKFLNEDGLTPAHRCIIAHNYNFDKKFIHALYEKVNQEFPAHLWLCTMALSKQHAKQQGLIKQKVNLHASIDMLNIKKFSDAHNSTVDSRNTFLLHRELIKHVDYLPFIKTAQHTLTVKQEEEQGLDPDLLDLL